jgi:hypothetical protein
MNARQRERVAYHEAGHAVAAYLLRRAFRYVTIIPKEGSQGHVMPRQRPGGQPYQLGDDVADGRRAERMIMVLLAGITAEAIRYGRRPPRWIRQSDIAQAIAWACCGAEPAVDPGGPWCWIEWLFRRTRYLLEAPRAWVAVEALAHALLQASRLSGPQARRIIQEARLDRARVEALIERQQRMAARLQQQMAARQPADGQP